MLCSVRRSWEREGMESKPGTVFLGCVQCSEPPHQGNLRFCKSRDPEKGKKLCKNPGKAEEHGWEALT